MSLKSLFYQYALWVFPLVFVLATGLLIFFILGVMRLVKDTTIVGVPLLEEQDVEFKDAGRAVLSIEGPHLTARFARLEYGLISPRGAEIPGRTVIFRARTSGLSRVRLTLKTYEIPQPGRYRLHVKGLGSDWAADADHRLVFSRPHAAPVIAYVVGIVLAALLAIGSVVGFLLRALLGATHG